MAAEAAPVTEGLRRVDVYDEAVVFDGKFVDDGMLDFEQGFDYIFERHLSYPVFSFLGKKHLGNSGAFFCSKGLILCRFQGNFLEKCSTLSSEEPFNYDCFRRIHTFS